MLRLDGSILPDTSQSRDPAVAALTRRVAELEHRLDVMKIIIGVVLFVKVALIALFLSIVFGHFIIVQNGPMRDHGQSGANIEGLDRALQRKLG